MESKRKVPLYIKIIAILISIITLISISVTVFFNIMKHQKENIDSNFSVFNNIICDVDVNIDSKYNKGLMLLVNEQTKYQPGEELLIKKQNSKYDDVVINDKYIIFKVYTVDFNNRIYNGKILGTDDDFALGFDGAVGKVTHIIPFLGYVYEFSTTIYGILIMVVAPLILLISILTIMALLKRSSLDEVKNEDEDEDDAFEAEDEQPLEWSFDINSVAENKFDKKDKLEKLDNIQNEAQDELESVDNLEKMPITFSKKTFADSIEVIPSNSNKSKKQDLSETKVFAIPKKVKAQLKENCYNSKIEKISSINHSDIFQKIKEKNSTLFDNNTETSVTENIQFEEVDDFQEENLKFAIKRMEDDIINKFVELKTDDELEYSFDDTKIGDTQILSIDEIIEQCKLKNKQEKNVISIIE